MKVDSRLYLLEEIIRTNQPQVIDLYLVSPSIAEMVMQELLKMDESTFLKVMKRRMFAIVFICEYLRTKNNRRIL